MNVSTSETQSFAKAVTGLRSILSRCVFVVSLQAICSLWLVNPALAHASEQGFVLLLPTNAYIAAGFASVFLTVILLIVMPDRVVRAIFTPLNLFGLRADLRLLRYTLNILSLFGLFWLIWQGFTGVHDPLRNPLPLAIWTGWWLILVLLQGVSGDIWGWVNPWRGVLVLWPLARRGMFRYPRKLGYMPALVLFMLFATFLLTDIAPSDPERLALFLSAYTGLTILGLCLFGRVWLLRAEWVSVLMRAYRGVAVLGLSARVARVGLPGWRIASAPAPAVSLAFVYLAMLAVGSFDGLNETFRWLAFIGINPLEFPGRSAVVGVNSLGLFLTFLGLVTVFMAALWLGECLARSGLNLLTLTAIFAPGILPIAYAYHFAHYLPSLLVEGQYLKNAVAQGMGLSYDPVTTGFFFRPASVRLIWLTQAGAVVIGHIVALLLAHRIAIRYIPDRGRAWLSQAPLSVFMLAYTLLGLWLLAAPKAG